MGLGLASHKTAGFFYYHLNKAAIKLEQIDQAERGSEKGEAAGVQDFRNALQRSWANDFESWDLSFLICRASCLMPRGPSPLSLSLSLLEGTVRLDGQRLWTEANEHSRRAHHNHGVTGCCPIY